MDIERRGAQRDHGPKTVFRGLALKPGSGQWWDNVRWDPETKQIVIHATHVPLGDGRTIHNYQIRLSLADVSALVTILGHAGSATDASQLRDHLSKEVPALVKLLACATGLAPMPMAESKPPATKPA